MEIHHGGNRWLGERVPGAVDYAAPQAREGGAELLIADVIGG
jgi:hypothetical protein